MNSQQMQMLEKKYGNLIHHIGHSISGDGAISGHDDNTQDLWIAAMEAIRGYEKKENMTFDEFWGTKGFDKYIKTCLWNLKNSKGSRITKRSKLTKQTVSVQEHEEVLLIQDEGIAENAYENMYSNMPSNFTDEETTLVKMLVESPDYITEEGRVNVQAVSKAVGKGWNTTRRMMDRIGEKIQNNL